MTKGDIGAVNWPGTRSIHFNLPVHNSAHRTYKAKNFLVPSRSDTANFIENLINTMSNNDKQTIINGGSAGSVPAAPGETPTHRRHVRVSLRRGHGARGIRPLRNRRRL